MLHKRNEAGKIILEEYKERFEKTAKKFFALHQPLPSSLLEEVKQFSLHGGKRLRPFLLEKAYVLGKGVETGDIFYGALAIEFLHHFFLIHDDIMDKSAMRRNAPTLYNKLGTERAILAGDLCFASTFLFLEYSSFSSTLKIKIYKEILAATITTIHGQELEEEFSRGPLPSLEEVLLMYYAKTARYSFILPLKLGFLLAGKEEKLLQAIEKVGDLMGTAFQLKDDLDELFDDSSPIEDKYTALATIALRKSMPQEQKRIQDLLSTSSLENKEELQNIFIRTGAVAYVQQAIRKRLFEARELLQSFQTTSFDEGTIRLLDMTFEYLLYPDG